MGYRPFVRRDDVRAAFQPGLEAVDGRLAGLWIHRHVLEEHVGLGCL